MHARDLSAAEKRQLRDDGFVVLRGAVPAHVIAEARRAITDALPKDERRLIVPGELATHPRVNALFYEGCVAALLERVMGPFPPVVSCQVAVTPAHNPLGGKPGVHIDGGWNGPLPETADEIDPATNRPKDAARYFGENDEGRGTNDNLVWMDPDRRLSFGSYTALVGICLSDQMTPGHGQFGVLKGLHEAVGAAFQKQRDAGTVLGAEGFDWPRVKIDDDGKPYVNALPNAVRTQAEALAETTAPIDGWPWLELTPVLMEPGDAVITLHSLPHAATPNLGPKARISVYFRVRRLRAQSPHEGTRRVGHGVSAHPDRGYFGQYLDYPEGFDPFQVSMDALCDHWREWDGMQDVLAERGD